MLFEVRGVAQNIVMGVAPLRKMLVSRFGSTGMNGDARAARARLDSYRKHVDVVGKDILELGPGHTLEVLAGARSDGARRCVGLDTELMFDEYAGVELFSYSGSTMPFKAGSFDVVWSSDVFEHVRAPAAVLRECFRVLRPGGAFLATIDLRDHYFLANERRWFSCLQYPDWLWRAMTSNRSAHVNRLRASDWRQLLEREGFVVKAFDRLTSDVLRQMYHAGEIRMFGRHLSEEDATTYRLEVAAEKPAS